MVVSTISSGAESVAVSALPVLPNTEATSGTAFDQLVRRLQDALRLQQVKYPEGLRAYTANRLR
jgi:hypothetical protein